MRKFFGGMVLPLLGLGHAAASSAVPVQPRQANALENCTTPFFNTAIGRINTDLRRTAQLARGSPYTPTTEPYNDTLYGGQAVLSYAPFFDAPDICGVRINVTDNIAFELYLPSRTKWNQRFLTMGNGGFDGNTSRYDMFSRAVHNWATMSTNTGHDVSGLAWAQNQRELQIDWAWRAMNFSLPYAKAIVAAYYEGVPKRADYYSGCSTGGRQGIRQIEADPTSFDAMLIGSPAWNVKSAMPILSRIGWLAETYGFKNSPVDPTLTVRVASLVFEKCNGLDGSTSDLVIRDIPKCYDLFRNSSTNEALWNGTNTSVSQRQAFLTIIEEFKAPPENTTYAGDGFDITSIADMTIGGFLQDSAENGGFNQQFAQYFLNKPGLIWDDDLHGKWLLGNASAWDDDVRANANPALLNTLYKGKVIMYTGTADGWVSSHGTRRAFDLAGGASNDRLAYFEIPSMPHCVLLSSALAYNPPWYIGGTGLGLVYPNSVIYMPNNTGLVDAKHDALMALVEWHEGNRAPERLTATAFNVTTFSPSNFTIVKRRPICRAPKVQTLVNTDVDVNTEEAWDCR
jgi:feruloyl esterase